MGSPRVRRNNDQDYHSVKTVIEHRLREERRIANNPFGFMPGMSTTKAIYLYGRWLKCTKGKRLKYGCYWLGKSLWLCTKRSVMEDYGEKRCAHGLYPSYTRHVWRGN